jgi:heptosyltransferase-2
MSENKKFLLIRFSSLGDVVLTTSVAKNIKRNIPDATIDILTKEEYKNVFLHNPDFTRVLAGISRKVKYDYILDLHSNIRSKYMKYLIPANERLVYNNASYARRLYLHTGRKNKVLNESVIDRYLTPLFDIGYKVNYVAPEIVLTKEELDSAAIKTGSKDYVLISPSAKWDTKKWILENYIGLVVRIIRELGLDIVLVGAKDDTELASKIYKGTGTLKSHITDLSGKTGIRELAAIIKNSKALVSVDSGAMHMGWAVGAKVVALFGPTVKEFGFQPKDDSISIVEKDMECRPCSLHGSKPCKYGDKACMQRIEVFEVFNELKKFL